MDNMAAADFKAATEHAANLVAATAEFDKAQGINAARISELEAQLRDADAELAKNQAGTSAAHASYLMAVSTLAGFQRTKVKYEGRVKQME